MSTIPELINENPLGTVFQTEEVLPDAEKFTKIMLGKSFRGVASIHIIECEDGSIMTLKGYAPGFDASTLEDDEEEDEEDDDWD